MSKLKYDESFPDRAGEYAAKGLNNREIAVQLGISNDSFYVYLRQFPEFAAAVETGRLAVADKVDGSLMDLAMGNCFVTTVRRGNSGHEIKTIRRRVPDVNAVIRWLERNTQYAGDGDVRTAEPVKINIPVNSKYNESFLEDVERHAAEGYTDLQIAWRLGIALSSFYNYKKQFPDFAAALDSGRRECYGRLRGQLLALALGKCTVTTETCRDGDFRKSTERQFPPNLKAIKYWLTGGAAMKANGNNGNNGNDIVYAQEHSKVSESGAASTQSSQTTQSDKHSAQEHSKVSESCAASTQSDKHSAQEHSKVSESCAAFSQSSQASQFSQSDKASARRFSKMSRKERQRLLKNRQENRSL